VGRNIWGEWADSVRDLYGSLTVASGRTTEETLFDVTLGPVELAARSATATRSYLPLRELTLVATQAGTDILLAITRLYP